MSRSIVEFAHLTARQHALVTREQLMELRYSSAQIRTLIQQGVLELVRPGVYLLGGAPRSYEQGLLAAVLSAGEYAAASHVCAGRVFSCRYTDDATYELTVPRPRMPHVDGVRVHSSSVLGDVDITEVNGVPCTTFERMLCDCTTTHSQIQLGHMLDDGIRRGVASIEALEATLLRLDSGPNRRLSIVQGLLAQRGGKYNPGGSNRELRVLHIVREAGLLEPEQQVRVRANGRTYFLDYAYGDRRRFIEYYELRSHGTSSAVAYDSDRISDLVSVGWRPLILTDANTDAEIAHKVRELLAEPAYAIELAS